MNIPIKNINEVITPNNGILLFVDVEDSKLKGKKSNNEILNFSNGSGSQSGGDLSKKEMPTNGLTFYWSMASDQIESGQTVKASAGNYNFTTLDDVQCCYIERGCYFSFDNTFAPLGSADRTVSFWHNSGYDATANPDVTVQKTGNIVSYGQPSDNNAFLVCIGLPYNTYGFIRIGIYANDIDIPQSFKFSIWEHVVITVKDKILYVYLNGYLKSTLNVTNIDTQSGDFDIGAFSTQGVSATSYQGYVSDFRVYDRALDDEEIKLLASEHCNYCVNSSSGSTEYITTKFYKCTSVNTANKTWSGYELILSNGKYTISSTLTTRLSYTSITPVVGTVYSEDALVKVAAYACKIPIDSLVFYAPLSATSSTAETGQTLTTDGSITYQTFKGIPCAYFNGSGTRIYSSSFSTISSSQPSTMSFWVYVTGKGGSNNEANMFGFGQWNNGRYAWTGKGNLANITGYCWGDRNGVGYDTPAYNTWYHVAFVVNPPNMYLYINGVLVSSTTNNSINTVSNGYPVVMGGNEQGASDRNLIGYLAGCRIYNRVLTQEEITALANEFTLVLDSDSGNSSGPNAIMTGNKFHLSGSEIGSLNNMNFNIEDTTATGFNRRWIAEGDSGIYIEYDSTYGWFIGVTYSGTIELFTFDPSLENPWDTTTWLFFSDATSTSVEITVTE